MKSAVADGSLLQASCARRQGSRSRSDAAAGPLSSSRSTRSEALTAASTAAARTSAVAWASAWAIFASADRSAALDEIGDLLLGFAVEALGLFAGERDDFGGLALGSAALLLEFLQERLGILTQALGLGEFTGNALAALIERGQHFPARHNRT